MKKIFLILTTILIFINAVAEQKTDSRSTEKHSADAVAANINAAAMRTTVTRVIDMLLGLE